MLAKWYGPAFISAFNKEIDFDSDNIYAMLLDATYTPDQDTHRYLSDVVAHEFADVGYTPNGVVMTGKSVTYTGGTNTFALDADDPTWPAVTWATGPRFMVAYDRTPATDATRPLICYWDFGATVPVTSADFVGRVNTAGIANVVIS